MLIATTPARKDRDHIKTIVYNDPTVPDRTDAIHGEDELKDDPLADMSTEQLLALLDYIEERDVQLVTASELPRMTSRAGGTEFLPADVLPP